MEKIKIIYKDEKYKITKKYDSDSGYDVRIETEKEIILQPHERITLNTGFQLNLPKDWEATIRPRSGLAKNHGITILNTPGTIDQEYNGTVKLIIINLGNEPFYISDGDRLAQITFQKIKRIEIEESYITETIINEENHKRGNKGFGSTGYKD